MCLIGFECGGVLIVVEVGKNLKKLFMELGGNDVFFILDDVDFDLFSKIIFFVCLYNVG